MKQQNNQTVTVRHTAGQKVLGALALVALFACGIMVGIAINGGYGRSEDKVRQTQCNSIAQNIINSSAKAYISSQDMERLKELNAMYEQTCAGYVLSTTEESAKWNAPDQKTCEVIEDLLEDRLVLAPSNDITDHSNNIDVYKKLVQYGCPENVDSFKEQIDKEGVIIEALKSGADNVPTCMEVESLLMQSLPMSGLNYSDIRIERAKIYANLSERGCPENSQAYVDLAAKELEIARALSDDKFSKSETVEVVETYKRLEMKQAANEVFEKVQKLTDPAIDFILQIQKIIEE